MLSCDIFIKKISICTIILITKLPADGNQNDPSNSIKQDTYKTYQPIMSHYTPLNGYLA